MAWAGVVSERKLAFASAVVVLLGLTAFVTIRESGHAPGPDGRPERAASNYAIQTGPPPALDPGETDDPRWAYPPSSPAPVTTPSPVLASRAEGEAKNAPAVAPYEAHAATAAARAFLDGYLQYSYGRTDARRIRAAARSLLRELEASPPRVPETKARERPRVVSVSAQAATGGTAVDVLAVVDDGQRRYSVPLSVREAGGRWVVSAIDG